MNTLEKLRHNELISYIREGLENIRAKFTGEHCTENVIVQMEMQVAGL